MTSPKTVKVDVTQQHIIEGLRMSFKYCPIALAIHEVVDPTLVITVAQTYALTKSPNDTTRYGLPSEVSVFIATFDKYGPMADAVQPFTFTMTREEI